MPTFTVQQASHKKDVTTDKGQFKVLTLTLQRDGQEPCQAEETPAHGVESDLHKATPRCANSRGHGTGGVTPMQQQRTSPLHRCFDAYDEQAGPLDTPCWIFRGAPRTRDGYSLYTVPGTGQRLYAHRAFYEHYVGVIPEGLVIDHLCRVHRCVNPAHLEPVTQRENLMRGETIPARNAAKTHCPQGHPYDEANTYVTKQGFRQCRACPRERRLARKAAA